MYRSCGLILCFLIILTGGSSLFAQNGYADELIEKRAELDALYDELDHLKDDYNARVSSLTVYRADLEVRLQQEELKHRRLSEELAGLLDKASEDTTETGQLTSGLMTIIDQSAKRVSAGIPFHIDERLAELEDLKASLENGDMTPVEGATNLWNFLASELALSRESGIYRQAITLDGHSMLADIARLGLVFLYFRTYDDRYGYARFDEGEYVYTLAASREEERQIRNLFDSLERNIHTGFFELPIPALPEGGRG